MNANDKRVLTIRRKAVAENLTDKFFRGGVKEGHDFQPANWKWSSPMAGGTPEDRDERLFYTKMYPDYYGATDFFEIIICFKNGSSEVIDAIAVGYPRKGNVIQIAA